MLLLTQQGFQRGGLHRAVEQEALHQGDADSLEASLLGVLVHALTDDLQAQVPAQLVHRFDDTGLAGQFDIVEQLRLYRG